MHCFCQSAVCIFRGYVFVSPSRKHVFRALSFFLWVQILMMQEFKKGGGRNTLFDPFDHHKKDQKKKKESLHFKNLKWINDAYMKG